MDKPYVQHLEKDLVVYTTLIKTDGKYHHPLGWNITMGEALPLPKGKIVWARTSLDFLKNKSLGRNEVIVKCIIPKGTICNNITHDTVSTEKLIFKEEYQKP